MLLNYLKTALRIMMRQKAYSLINVAGLSVGVAATLIIVLYVLDEASFDRFHRNPHELYRITFSGRVQGNDIISANSPAPLAQAVQTEIPGVNEVVRFGMWRTIPVSYENKNFTEHLLMADSNFFKFFNFKVIAGNPQTALQGTNKIVITESIARKYFGDENPLGKILLREAGKISTEVTGVVQDPPHNSHIQFDMVLSGESWEYMKNTQWTSNNIYTYIRLAEGTDIASVNTRLSEMVEKNMGAEIEKYLGFSFKQFREQGNDLGLSLQPFLDIHLKSDLADEISPNGNIQYLYIFSAVAVFIILIACINFMNLSTARSANRAKEVGVRKTIGAGQRKLLTQFLAESSLYSFLSVLLAVVIIGAVLPSFNTLSGKELTMGIFMRPVFIAGLLAVAIILGFLAGSYPAFYLTAFKPTEVLKGRLRAGFKNSAMRNILVVLQFMISISLIFGSLVVFTQLKFMQEKNLGFNKENVVSLLHTIGLGKNGAAFKNEINNHPEFKGASYANRLPPNIEWNNAVRKGNSEQDFILSIYQVDYDHLATMGYTMLEGRFFSRDFPSDSSAIILNETAYKQMGYTSLDDAVVLSYQSNTPTPFKVIGVIKDFNFESLKNNVKPMGIWLGREPNFEMAIRLSAGNTAQQLAVLENIWKKYAPDAPFEYSFIDQNFDALFRAEQRLGRIILIFTALAIGIACLGLFGLAAYTAEQRAKEIGIRKVMGASVSQIMILLTKDFALLVVIAFAIAAPLGYYFCEEWLTNFATRINIPIWMIAASGAISLVIAMVTISFQSFNTARENPVRAMKAD